MRTDKWLLAAIAFTWLVAGAVEPHLPNPSQVFSEAAIIHGALLAVLFFAWCRAHAASHHIRPPTAAPILVGVIPLIGVPYYFFRGFGWRSGLWLSALAIGSLGGFALLYIAAFTLSAQVGN